MTQDLSNGLPIEAEGIVSERPDEPFWAENLLVSLYDPEADIGFWLHLGSLPSQWDMWEDRVFLCLPGDEGVMSTYGYYYTPQEKKPAGPNLAFRCIEPFKRWKVTFDGFAPHVSNAEMQQGRVPDSLRKRLIFDLDLDCVSPVWDAHASTRGHGGMGDMSTQSWGREHYEQLFRARGHLQVDDKTYEINAATGWRDHSRGPRAASSGESFGGHAIAACLFDSGKSFVLSTYWRPDGMITMEGAAVVDEAGAFHFAEVLEPPKLTELQMSGERVPIRLRWDGGELNTVLETRRSVWLSVQKARSAGSLVVGKDLGGEGRMYVVNFGPCEWDGEGGHVYLERTAALNDSPQRST